MDNLDYLFAAFAIVWAALFAYIFFLSVKQRQLRQDVEMLEKLNVEMDNH